MITTTWRYAADGTPAFAPQRRAAPSATVGTTREIPSAPSIISTILWIGFIAASRHIRAPYPAIGRKHLRHRNPNGTFTDSSVGNSGSEVVSDLRVRRFQLFGRVAVRGLM